MVCPKCNSQYADNLPACPFCSAAAQAPQQAPFQVPQGAAEFAPPPAPVKKKSKAGKIIPIVIAAIFVVLGIASTIMNNKEATHVMIYEDSFEYGETTDEYTFYCKGDKIYKMQEVIVFEYDEIYEEYVEDEAEYIVAALDEEYGDYDFIEITHKVEGTTITITLVYSDIEENIDEYVELDFIEEGTDVLSYEMSKEHFEEEGYKVVEE